MFSYSVYVLFGILPSFLWLLYYLKKDTNPEPKVKILKVFIGGAISAIFAALIEILLLKNVFQVNNCPWLPYWVSLLYVFLIVALIEETLKYLAVKIIIFRDMHFDEPIDSMIYLITSAMGFAALENVLLFFSEGMSPTDTFLVAIFRFLGATFLHALCSGIFGFFISLSFTKIRKRKILFLVGFSTAVLLHAAYNFSIIQLNSIFKFVLPACVLMCLMFFLSIGVRKLKNTKSICKIQEKS